MTTESRRSVKDDPVARIQHILSRILFTLVEQPEEIRVFQERNGDIVNLTIYAAPEDRGLIIGSNGRNIRSLRTLIHQMGGKANTTIHVDLVEDHYDKNPTARAGRLEDQHG